jgi:hypothetical protein
LKSLNAVEWNYEIHDKEMLAVMRALEEWRHFLEDLDRPQEPQVLHDHEKTKSPPAGLFTFQGSIRHAPPSQKKHGQM